MTVYPHFGMMPAKSHAVGGAMHSEYHPGRYWMVLGFSFICGVAFFLLAAALILQAWQGHGSQPGNILRLGLAIFSFLVGIFFITVGTLYHASFHESHDAKSR